MGAHDDGVASTEKALQAKGVKAKGTALDVGDAKALRKWVDDSAKEFGGIDMAVANVSALAIPDEDENWDTSFRVDLMGTVNMCKAVIPYLEKSDIKSLLAISSVSGREADFAAGPYGTFKTAIIGYMAGLALSLAEKGIRANTVSPGNTYFPGGVWENIEGGTPICSALRWASTRPIAWEHRRRLLTAWSSFPHQSRPALAGLTF